MNKKAIKIDFNSLDSIKKAEKQKYNFENKGLMLFKTTQISFNTFILNYK